MVVLLLFNQSTSWTVQRMQDNTQIKIELLLEVLCGLLKSKLLICSEINDDELKESNIKMNYTIQINDAFER
jgi:cullin 1